MNDVSAIVPFDFHVHTSFSHDGGGTVDEYCERATAQHLKAVGFCEHVDLDSRDFVSGRHDYEAYRAAVMEARERWGGRLVILMGAEVGYVPRVHDEIRAFLGGHPYDFVIGSVHAINDGASGVSEEYEALETFARMEITEAYGEYFETVRQMVVSGLFDAVGHLDLINRFGVNYLPEKLEWGRFYGALRRIFEGVIKREMAVEINTSGLRQAPQATYPPRELLQLYREVGGEKVMIGSDAHAIKDLGAGVPAALKLARDLGLNPFVCFKDRKEEEIKW